MSMYLNGYCVQLKLFLQQEEHNGENSITYKWFQGLNLEPTFLNSSYNF
jgi:hypothetical protein